MSCHIIHHSCSLCTYNMYYTFAEKFENFIMDINVRNNYVIHYIRRGKGTYIAPHREKLISEVLRYGSHSFYTASTPYKCTRQWIIYLLVKYWTKCCRCSLKGWNYNVHWTERCISAVIISLWLHEAYYMPCQHDTSFFGAPTVAAACYSLCLLLEILSVSAVCFTSYLSCF